jgi:hypothetical protein
MLSHAYAEPPPFLLGIEPYDTTLSTLEALALPNPGMPDAIMWLHKFVREKRVAFVTDFPYASRGSDATSGKPLSTSEIKARGCSSAASRWILV